MGVEAGRWEFAAVARVPGVIEDHLLVEVAEVVGEHGQVKNLRARSSTSTRRLISSIVL